MGGLVASLLLNPLFEKVARRLGFMDQPEQRKVHSNAVPKVGGLAMFVAFLVVFSVYKVFAPQLSSDISWWWLLPATLVVGLGFVDDLFNLRPSYKLLGQVAVAIVAVLVLDINVSFFRLPFSGEIVNTGWWGFLLTALWIVVFMNVVNLIDGLDGLAGGIVLIASVNLFVVSLLLNQLGVESLLLLLAGVVLGFLRYNFFPARVFMGDAGSLFLGYVLAVSSIQGVLKSSVAIALAIPLLSLFVPMLDTFLAIVRRTKNGVHVFRADSDHLHHKLMRKGFSHKGTVLVMYLATVVLNLAAILFAFADGFFSILIIILVIIISFTTLYRSDLLGVRSKK